MFQLIISSCKVWELRWLVHQLVSGELQAETQLHFLPIQGSPTPHDITSSSHLPPTLNSFLHPPDTISGELSKCLTTTISCRIRGTRSMSCCPLFPNRADNLSYDFEYEDADEDESGDIGIENKYYNAKQMKLDNPDEAVDEFLGIPPMEMDKSEWCARSLLANQTPRLTDRRQGFQRVKTSDQVGVQARSIPRCRLCPQSPSWHALTQVLPGRRTLPRAPHIRQVRRYAQLLRKVHQ